MRTKVWTAGLFLLMLVTASRVFGATLDPRDLVGTFKVDGKNIIGQPVFLVHGGGFDTDFTDISGRYYFDKADGFFFLAMPHFLFSGESEISGTLLINGYGPRFPRFAFAMAINGTTPISWRALNGAGEWSFKKLTGELLTTVLIFGLNY